jgi:hypothetical protein
MDRKDLALVEAIAGRELLAFGYELHVPVSMRARVRAVGSRALTAISRAAWRARIALVLTFRRDALPPPPRW